MTDIRPRILLISSYYKEPHRWMRSTQTLSKLWASMGFDVFILTMANTANGSAYEEEKISEHITLGKVQDIFLKDPWNYGIAPRFFTITNRVVKKFNPDHIIVNKILFWSSISVIWLRLQGKKVDLMTDALVGITWFTKGRLFNICAWIYAHTLGWLIMLSANRIVTFHPQPPNVLKRMGIYKKTKVIASGINAERFLPNQQHDKLIISYVGRLESVKRVDDYLAVTTVLKKKYPHIEIRVIGKFNEQDPLYKQYKDDVNFMGLQDDIPALLGASHLFVLCSYCEGLPNALMEAMASGCCCVASNVGGVPYLIKHEQEGLIYNSGDRIMLAKYIEEMITDSNKRQQFGKAAMNKIHNEFDWKVTEQKWSDLFLVQQDG